MHPTRRPSCRMARSMDSPSPSTQNRRLFSRSALGMTGTHESTNIYTSMPPDDQPWTAPMMLGADAEGRVRCSAELGGLLASEERADLWDQLSRHRHQRHPLRLPGRLDLGG